MAADRVKQILAQRGLSQADLARRIGCSRVAVTRVIGGSLISPFLQRSIAEILGEDEADLWGDLYWYPRYAELRSVS